MVAVCMVRWFWGVSDGGSKPPPYAQSHGDIVGAAFRRPLWRDLTGDTDRPYDNTHNLHRRARSPLRAACADFGDCRRTVEDAGPYAKSHSY